MYKFSFKQQLQCKHNVSSNGILANKSTEYFHCWCLWNEAFHSIILSQSKLLTVNLLGNVPGLPKAGMKSFWMLILYLLPLLQHLTCILWWLLRTRGKEVCVTVRDLNQKPKFFFLSGRFSTMVTMSKWTKSHLCRKFSSTVMFLGYLVSKNVPFPFDLLWLWEQYKNKVAFLILHEFHLEHREVGSLWVTDRLLPNLVVSLLKYTSSYSGHS